MSINTIEDVYQQYSEVKRELLDAVGQIEGDIEASTPAENVWSAKQLIEHIAMVNDGIHRICDKLLRKAESEGLNSDGRCVISQAFVAGTEKAREEKLMAPAVVQPTGSQSISDSLAKLERIDERFDEMRDRFNRIDGTQNKFPHPYFGDLSAHEWLVLRAGHTARHLRQLRERTGI